MATPAVIDALQHSALAALVRGDDLGGREWLFPMIETVHVLALATVYGTIAMVDLRMLGVGSRGARLSRVTDEVLPWTWTAFLIAALSGSLLFVSKAATYWNNFEVRGKFLFMALAGVNMAVYQLVLHRRVGEWDNRLPPPGSVRLAGALSLTLWTGVIIFGRWIGWTT